MPKVAKEIVMADANKRSAAVTGAGGGLGRDIALGLAAKNYRGFGTAMTPGEIADIKQASGGAVTPTRCELTAEPAVKGWATRVGAGRGGGRAFLITTR